MQNNPSCATLRKQKSRARETSDQVDNHHACDRETKRLKRSAETAEQREERLRKNRERYHKRKGERALRNIDEHLNRQQDESRSQDIDECRLPESDRKLLQDFRSKINAFTNNLCTICNERFPSIDLRGETCRRCYDDKNPSKKFSASNNMDPEEAPDEL